MAKIRSITVRECDIKAPVYIQLVAEQGEWHWVKFKAVKRVSNSLIKFARTEECTSGLERHVG